MKAVIYHTHQDIRLEDIPVPSYDADELLLLVDGCGLCGSDILKITAQAAPPVPRFAGTVESPPRTSILSYAAVGG